MKQKHTFYRRKSTNNKFAKVSSSSSKNYSFRTMNHATTTTNNKQQTTTTTLVGDMAGEARSLPEPCTERCDEHYFLGKGQHPKSPVFVALPSPISDEEWDQWASGPRQLVFLSAGVVQCLSLPRVYTTRTHRVTKTKTNKQTDRSHFGSSVWP